jgi:EAL domain-containing protein (putative c-di-GMP-specific phosphodiesterase class I)
MAIEQLDTRRSASLEEALRLDALHRLLIIDTPPELVFDEIVNLAAGLFPGCHAAITLVDEYRTWIKASTDGGQRELPRNESLCSIVIQQDECTVLLDARNDLRLIECGFRNRQDLPGFVAGVPLKTHDGQRVGVLCIFHSSPRASFSERQRQKLCTLAALTADRMELRGLQQQAKVSSQANQPGGIRALGERVLYLVPEIQPAVQARMRLETELGYGIENGQMEIRYQPEIDLNTRMIVGFEALVRWNHPTKGLLSPDEFIPLAEETGLIVPLGRWALREACREAQIWRLATFDRLDLRVSVNLSAVQFESDGLVETVKETLDETGLYPEALRLEITESTLMKSTETVLETMKSLRDLGVGLHMDDFGTGFSSLHTLHSFPFDTIKIDRSFVQRLTNQKNASQIVQTIISLCRELDLEVVAEGIETEIQAEILRLLGCHFGQGYCFSYPLRPAEVVDLLEQQINEQLSPETLRFQLNPHYSA